MPQRYRPLITSVKTGPPGPRSNAPPTPPRSPGTSSPSQPRIFTYPNGDEIGESSRMGATRLLPTPAPSPGSSPPRRRRQSAFTEDFDDRSKGAMHPTSAALPPFAPQFAPDFQFPPDKQQPTGLRKAGHIVPVDQHEPKNWPFLGSAKPKHDTPFSFFSAADEPKKRRRSSLDRFKKLLRRACGKKCKGKERAVYSPAAAADDDEAKLHSSCPFSDEKLDKTVWDVDCSKHHAPLAKRKCCPPASSAAASVSSTGAKGKRAWSVGDIGAAMSNLNGRRSTSSSPSAMEAWWVCREECGPLCKCERLNSSIPIV
ncbi:hypothetical protein C8034_v012380 [Colletotrichum sidae]|uniref:Uncharacterized protein n=1 Tax=Colletotrichum sidae TaxID=1347389 RepID=A0A4R8TF44_9PEZI|nr:hypothetical protein C8034_v012380 [Colletotrichum sidae]